MISMLEKLENIRLLIGNTRLIKLQVPNADVYAKLEYTNLFGSVKDRAAYYIVSEAIKSGQLTADHFIVESSSGNFAIALMGICNLLGIPFVPVIDPNINEEYEKLLRLSCEVVKVQEKDQTGGYLLTRINTVKEILEKYRNAFWTDQYSNINNYLGYYHGLGAELCGSFKKLDYVFVGVSSGGTITGVSRRLKEHFPNVKIIAVDIEGSLIFGDVPRKRYISGIGASKRSELVEHAKIDEVIKVTHLNIIDGCRRLLREQSLFAGASSGACYYAVSKYFKDRTANGRKPVVAFICPDKGSAYLNNIYDDAWVAKIAALIEEEAMLPYTT